MSGAEEPGAPVGRRLVLGLAGLGVAGVLGGATASRKLSEWLAPAELRDPTGLLATLPLGPAFRFYSVTGSVDEVSAADYRLSVGGLVAVPATYGFDDLRALPQTSFSSDFHCVTGWTVPGVAWTGVPLRELLDLARPAAQATAVRFRSFDGTYTESLPLPVARHERTVVALGMLGGAVSHAHGGPVRMYVDGQYGYKSTKWLSAVELTEDEVPGYWEHRGYAVDGTVRA
ncbi:molybdopterin-dependent oxidoreductase [Nocardioides anomalus]|uniref:Molybdopterin-dependent oxidoreductase n=1 Tax=Nocardioides anomalus TaxID=2712223 RepID=A0A6G6W8T1_9ACTN|nr:molybdopterin-dependent oxidoreductase [Nocardioides anomalus]QIG41634.1 molybdopterin-dependent oxidoreductase [Nocardioides anomalus]